MTLTCKQSSRVNLVLAAAVLGVVMPSAPVHGVHVLCMWNNTAGGNWHTAGNWDTDIFPGIQGVPDGDDAATFNMYAGPPASSCEVYLNSNAQCGNLGIQDPQMILDLNGQTLTVTGQGQSIYEPMYVIGTHYLRFGTISVTGQMNHLWGTLYVQYATINCSDTAVSGGAAGGVLDLNGSRLNSWSFTGQNLTLGNASLTTNSTIITNGQLYGFGTLLPGTNYYNNGSINAANGNLVIQPAAGGRGDLDGSNELGVVRANQGSFRLAGTLNDPIDTGVSVTAPYSATSDSGWVMGGNSTITLIGGSTSVTPYQVATFSAGAGVSALSASINASGCSVFSGATDLYPLADVNVAANAQLCMDGQTTFRGGTVLGTGYFYHNGNVIVAESSTVGVTHYYWDASPDFISGGASHSLTINPGKAFTVTSSDLGYYGGTITVGSGGTLTVSSTLSMATGGQLVLNGGGVAANSLRFYGTNQLTANSASWLRVNRLVGIPAAFAFPGSITFGHLGGASSVVHTVGAGQSMTIGNNFIVGYDKAATFTINGGGDVTDSSAYIGYTTGGVGTVILDGEGSTWTTTSSLYVGNAAAGVNGAGNVIVRNGGDLTVLNNRIGTNSGSAGTFTLTGTNSTVTHSGAGALVIGSAAGSSGRLSVESSGLYSTGSATTTINPTGTLNVDGGVFNAGANVAVNGGKLIRSATGQFNLASGRTLIIQNGGSASFTGTHIIDSNAALVTGTNSAMNISDVLYLGLSGAGSMNITTGGAVTSAAAFLGRNVGSTGTVAINGANSRWTNNGGMWVGGSDTAAQGNATITVGTAANPGGALSVNGTLTNWPTGTINVGSGGQLYAGGMVNHGRLLATGGAGSLNTLDGTGTTKITGPATLSARWVRQNQLEIASASGVPGLVNILPDGMSAAAVVLKSLVIDNPPGGSPQGTLDLSNNAMVLDYTGASPLASIRSLLSAGYAGGAWTGGGIRSSTAAATPQCGLGYAEATSLFTTFPASFAGQLVDNTSLLLMYTLYGDANLDRSVTLDDFTRLAGGFGAVSTWSQGDFNFDGVTNLSDFTALAANFGGTIPANLPREDSVPEPAVMGLLAMAAGFVAHRRR